jgi:hypothetical protein
LAPVLAAADQSSTAARSPVVAGRLPTWQLAVPVASTGAESANLFQPELLSSRLAGITTACCSSDPKLVGRLVIVVALTAGRGVWRVTSVVLNQAYPDRYVLRLFLVLVLLGLVFLGLVIVVVVGGGS